ncbi:MAG: hypothetical protein IGQ88_05735 [Gloeomargaritaceae cyanobacterium C42_A2020_066]|nr:hypothetical protein [Gloeomargaritaceae cyanobacterium C42_A2020_066]
MPPVELNRKGFKALVDALGYADAIRFIRQYDNGSRDYTKERHQWLDKLTLDDIWADIRNRQSQMDANDEDL